MKAFRPIKDYIINLKEGDLAQDCFGNISKVVRISYRGQDIGGLNFVGYYVEFGSNGGTISHSIKEGEILATLPLIDKYKRMDEIPENMITEDFEDILKIYR